MTLPGRLPQRFMLGVWAVPLLYDRSAHPTSSIRRKRKLGLAGEEEEPPPSDPAEYAAVKRWDEIRSTDRKEALPFHIMIGCSYTQYVIYRHNTGWMTPRRPLGGSPVRCSGAVAMAMDPKVPAISGRTSEALPMPPRRPGAIYSLLEHMAQKQRKERPKPNEHNLIYRASSTRTCSYSLAT